ncbi:MAG: hypothetical protein KKC84_02570, partial [Candidatus Omnitrophica bacterium]|nr:hypothetical protein [Candidatus Omnitrophota bacterium]
MLIISVDFKKMFYAYYDTQQQELFVRDETTRAWQGGGTPGGGASSVSTYGELVCSQTQVSSVGNRLMVSWRILPHESFVGRRYVFLAATDSQNLSSGWIKRGDIDSRMVDATPPTGTIEIDNGELFTATREVALTLSAADDNLGWGLNSMQFSNDNENWSEPEVYTTTKNWTLGSGDGEKTVYVRYSDRAGNWSTQQISAQITLDTTAPLVPIITIDDGAAATASTTVTLSVYCEDALSGPGQMQFSNDNENWSEPESYATTKSWTLLAGEGRKALYVRFSDNVGNWTIEPIRAGIVLDTTPPVLPLVTINDGVASTDSPTVTLSLYCEDELSEVGKMQFSNDNENWSEPEEFVFTKTWDLSPEEGQKTVYVRFSDIAGNWTTQQIQAQIILSGSAPAGSVIINNQNEYASSTQVILALSAQDDNGVSLMRFSNDNRNWSEPEEYSTTKTWTLSSGDGEKTVYARFMDNADTWSTETISDSIVLDTVAPLGGILTINAGALATQFLSVQLSTFCEDITSGISQMQFSNDNLNWSEPESYAETKTWELLAGEGQKTVYARFADGAGNWTTQEIMALIFFDTESPVPTGTVVIANGERYSPIHRVTLTLTAQDEAGIRLMQFSNDNLNWSEPESYAETKTWDLSSESEDGEKSVYVRFKNGAERWSTAQISDTIIVDTTSPTVPVITVPQVTTPNDILQVDVSSSDDLSGVAEYMYVVFRYSAPITDIWVSNGNSPNIRMPDVPLTVGESYIFV